MYSGWSWTARLVSAGTSCRSARRPPGSFTEARQGDFSPHAAHRTFTFDYDPRANNGIGRVIVTLDGEVPFTLDLKPEQRKAGATFDRFGLMSFRRGGKFSILYFDDLTYTTRRPIDAPAPRHHQQITTVPYPK